MAAATLDITSNTIRYGERVYSVPNITQINVEIWKHKPRMRWRTILVFAGLALLCFYWPFIPLELYIAFMEKRAWPGLPILLATVFALLACYGLWDRTKLTFYTLLIETSGRSASLFSSRSKQVILDAADKIYKVMEDRTAALSYHLNLGDVINTTGSNNKIVSRTSIGEKNNF